MLLLVSGFVISIKPALPIIVSVDVEPVDVDGPPVSIGEPASPDSPLEYPGVAGPCIGVGPCCILPTSGDFISSLLLKGVPGVLPGVTAV